MKIVKIRFDFYRFYGYFILINCFTIDIQKKGGCYEKVVSDFDSGFDSY